ncbi:hypothetical protein T07_6579 [Trichinella nelsoni]|uniref:Uncharacterized protein n=1 Tax=Trichinella nelsoni TaxID=6336 RepID=A0A0V0RLU9_9BILA|nr:hypothetical protein T07_6579 [Trichinella nelsoni]
MIVRRISFGNNGRRELKETPSSNWKIPCLGVIDYSGTFWTKCEAPHHHASIKAAVAGERAQSSFDVVFSVVVALRRGWAPVKTASSGMCCRLIHSCLRLVEKRNNVVLSVQQTSTVINMKKSNRHRNGKWLYSDDGFPFVVTHVALVFTSLPRMIASNTFAMNEMRNQNAISESKLFRTDERTCKRLESVRSSQGQPTGSTSGPNRDTSLKPAALFSEKSHSRCPTEQRESRSVGESKCTSASDLEMRMLTRERKKRMVVPF